MTADFSRRALLRSAAGVALAAATPASSRGEEMHARLDTLVPSLLARSRVPGVSIAVIADHRVMCEKAYGAADLATGRTVTPATIFQAASLTKPLFAFAALERCERGALGLDTPIVSYVPHASVSRDPRAHRITPRMVLSHTSGLPNWANGKRPLKMEFDPGAHFGYSGEAFNVLQEAVETQAGRPLGDLMIETVAAPFGLAESAFIWDPAFETTAATGYEWDGSPVAARSKPTTAMAASSLHTTARDYARFMIASLAHGARRPEHLDYATERMMLSPQVRLAGPLAWGLGWALLLREGGDMHWHFGDSRGYMTYAAYDRTAGNGAVIFTNARHGLRLCHAIAKELLDGQDTIFSWIYDVFYEGELPQWP